MFLHAAEVRYVKDYEVEVRFSDGRTGVADLSDSLTGPVFEPLRDKSNFKQVRVDSELQTITWPNGADLAPEYVYFKAFQEDPALQEQFKRWGYLDGENQARAEEAPEIVPGVPWRVSSVQVLPGFCLAVRFVDGTAGEVDLSRLVTGERAGVFGKLRDPALFAQVFLDYGAVTWPGEIDLAPDAMYDEIREHGRWVLE